MAFMPYSLTYTVLVVIRVLFIKANCFFMKIYYNDFHHCSFSEQMFSHKIRVVFVQSNVLCQVLSNDKNVHLVLLEISTLNVPISCHRLFEP